MGESVEGSVLERTASISVNVSYTTTTTNSSSGFDKEDSLIVTTFSTSNYSLQANNSRPQTSSLSCTTSPAGNHQQGSSEGPSDIGNMMMSQFPFHTMNVHLQRGKNLVAKDACGNAIKLIRLNLQLALSSSSLHQIKLSFTFKNFSNFSSILFQLKQKVYICTTVSKS
jgi:hypothetical protein